MSNDGLAKVFLGIVKFERFPPATCCSISYTVSSKVSTHHLGGRLSDGINSASSDQRLDGALGSRVSSALLKAGAEAVEQLALEATRFCWGWLTEHVSHRRVAARFTKLSEDRRVLSSCVAIRHYCFSLPNMRSTRLRSWLAPSAGMLRHPTSQAERDDRQYTTDQQGFPEAVVVQTLVCQQRLGRGDRHLHQRLGSSVIGSFAAG